ncbi:MAG: site-specific DNA-methyltransferase, partial [Anaerolineae bacterium]|nr:site-specific DNA-methyltransferase [Anaerolineae bacterium]
MVGSGFAEAEHKIHQSGKVPEDWWEIAIAARGKEYLGYPTQKPKKLLERIIRASTQEGDVVLDAYCGCGTTISVAERLKRRWIGIDITYQSISLVLRRLYDEFGMQILDSITIDGIPRDLESAKALAKKKDDRLRKEFEKWAILTYTNNRAIINDKKGADQGIDGIAYFMTGIDSNAKAVFQVKSGAVGRKDIAQFNSDRIREGAE